MTNIPAPNRTIVTLARATSLLSYDAETGAFSWRISRVRAKAGADAGTDSMGPRTKKAYRFIKIDQRRYQAHRLAWLFMTGEWPKGYLDHRDGNPLNNSWSNLRLASPSQNQANKGLQRNNTVGFKGVSLLKHGKFGARAKFDGKVHWLGSFATAEEAHAAYAKAFKKHFGEFARVA